MKKIVIASNNVGKLREFAILLAPFAFEAIPQSALGISEADEPHATFIENALAKARHASRAAGLPALADDSGICVPVLGGAPGVWSARYANNGTGEPKSDTRNNEKLIRELAHKEDRRAFYYCSLVLVMHADDPHPLIADGECWGEIVDSPVGSGGFGYDPYFYLPAFGKTAAELTNEEKNRISHRGLAMQALAAKLKAQRAFSD
ncbi:nucleoside-triphosphate diphosphatase [Betaproteobacteria bacterium UKL13-2]|nr:nucleoside-triphosphate diphosphatase [Betaproteobacteria bacterium UKL13-2]HCG52043.1 non-canonical purine NTP pyrophosphatase, RdgB/HAM1 family [Betaproteobacteria bacterium]